MKDEILDYEWVTSHETMIEEAEATLFQQCISLDNLLATCGMLVDKNIPYQIIAKENDSSSAWNTITEVHIEEKNLEIGTMFLDLLMKRDSTYPNHEFRNYTAYELQRLYELDENSNPYKQALIEIELKRKGINILNQKGKVLEDEKPLKTNETWTNQKNLIVVIAFFILAMLGILFLFTSP